MNKKTKKEYNIESDEYIRVSGVQGGKEIAEKLAVFAFIMGISLFAIVIFTLFHMIFVTGFPKNWPITLIIFSPQVIGIILGLMAIIAGYSIYKDKHVKT